MLHSSARARLRLFTGASTLGVAMAAALVGAASAQEVDRAQPRAPEATAQEVEEVVVTGSLIRGTPEDAALPVDVVSAEELQKQGSPSLVDLIKSIPAMQGVLGESNQFGSAQTTGSGTVNLRGLGSARTLVLMNGRRLAPSPQNGVPDTNLLPIAAVGRIEVLKDGAAATYGSDAIGGVVNFITRTDLDGIEVNAQHQFIEGSDGESQVSINFGKQFDRGDLLISAGYRHRGELDTLERDWAVNPLERNPGGSWSSFGNPGVYSTNLGVSVPTRFADPACEAVGSELRIAATGAPTCYFQFGRFNNIVEEEHHAQVYGQFNYELSDSVNLHAEALYAFHDVPEENTSPSYSPVQNPPDSINGPAPNGVFYIPLSNPGLSALLPQLTTAQAQAVQAAGGVYTVGLLFRPYGVGGNPLTGKSKHDSRYFDATRLSIGLNGESNGVDWDIALTHMVNHGELRTPDIVLSRLQYALRGLGGEGCNPATGTPGVGPCLYFNPFSTGYAGNAASGEANPNFVAGSPAALANSAQVAEYLFEDYAYDNESSLTVLDAVFGGETPFNLSGGPISLAVGAQYRINTLERQPNALSNGAINPCPIEGDTTCTVAGGRGNGPFTFFGPLSVQDFEGDAYALFSEAQVPVFDNLSIQLAARYEDFGGQVGSTFNPKLAVKWEATDFLAFRGSVGSTFRSPPQNQLAPDPTTTLVFRSQAGGYRPTDTFGNPNLQPETADTYNVGAILDIGGFNATLDYWNFDFQDPITTESVGNMLATLFANNCNLPAAFLARFTTANGVPFAPGACVGTNLSRTRSNVINGSYVKTSGIDFTATYRVGDYIGGEIVVGADGTYTIEYQTGEQFVEGVKIAESYDFAGTLGQGPQFRGNAFVEYTRDIHNLRATLRYIGEQTDTRNGQFGAGNIFGPAGNGILPPSVAPEGAEVERFVTVDLAYRAELPFDATLTAVVGNVFDEDPPFARLDLSYDPFTANPLGRTFKLGVTKRF